MKKSGGIKLFPIHYLDKLAPVALIILSTVSALFSSSILTVGVFGLTLAIYLLLKFNSKLFVCAATSMLLLSTVFLACGSSVEAIKIAIIAYYFLIIGVFGILIEDLRKETKRNVKNLEAIDASQKQGQALSIFFSETT